MPVAILKKDGFIEDVVSDGKGYELDVIDLAQINKSLTGHQCFQVKSGRLIYHKKLDVRNKVRGTNNDIDTSNAVVLNGHKFDDEFGYFGNVWIRKLYFPIKGALHDGHKHDHDHMSFLVKGRVLIEVDGYEPTIFTAPTYITIKAEYGHKITALEDDTLWLCIFALRDEEGDHYGGDNSPYIKKES